MTRAEATKEARKIAQQEGATMVVVLEGPHREEHKPEDSHGYCPEAAKPILYKHGTVVETIRPT